MNEEVVFIGRQIAIRDIETKGRTPNVFVGLFGSLDARMGASADHISFTFQEIRLERRKREDESYNDVLERILGEITEADFYDGFGSLSDDQADAIRDMHKNGRQTSKERMQRLASDGDEPESRKTQ